uniref:Uncharacterized protein n=1 Tax=Oryza nivara TaxID=4536 RepID=A0A0E0J5Q4_ORYNI
MAVVLTHGVVDEGSGERRWGWIWLVTEEAGKEAARRGRGEGGKRKTRRWSRRVAEESGKEAARRGRGEGGKRKTRRWSRRVAEESRTTPSASGGGGGDGGDAAQLDGELKLNFVEKKPRVASGK